MPKFGPAGNAEAFYEAGFKSSLDMPAWLSRQGLEAYEYQCGRGVRITSETAAKLGDQAEQFGIVLSIHAPYYINLATQEIEKQEKSIGYIRDSLAAAQAMRASRVIFHPGSAAKAKTREEALAMAVKLLKRTIQVCDDLRLLDNCCLCPEVMGKNNQLGNLEEVIALCEIDERLIPCVDFGHLNARRQGAMKTLDDYRDVFNQIGSRLGQSRLTSMHMHFSRIEFTAGGEKQHHTLADTQFGPDFEPLAQVMAEQNLDPVIICESNGTQAKDAVALKTMYESLHLAQIGQKA